METPVNVIPLGVSSSEILEIRSIIRSSGMIQTLEKFLIGHRPEPDLLANEISESSHLVGVDVTRTDRGLRLHSVRSVTR